MATDPRLLQSQQRNIENAASLLLRKRQFDQEIESKAKEAELSGIMTMLRQKDLPIETRTELANRALMKLRVPQTTPSALQGREESLQRRAMMQDLTQSGFEKSLNVNPEQAQQFLQAGTGQRPLEGVQMGLAPKEKQTIESEKALTEQRKEAARFNKVRADKVLRETDNVNGLDPNQVSTAINANRALVEQLLKGGSLPDGGRTAEEQKTLDDLVERQNELIAKQDELLGAVPRSGRQLKIFQNHAKRRVAELENLKTTGKIDDAKYQDGLRLLAQSMMKRGADREAVLDIMESLLMKKK